MYSIKNKNTKNKSWFRRQKKLVLVGLLVVIIGLGIVGYVIFSHKDTTLKTTETANSETKGEVGNAPTPDDKNNNATNNDSTPQNSDKSPSSGGTDNQSATLIEPSGNFVSNHHPNLSGSPAPNTIESTCNTTPGASCQITFKNGATTKSLPSQTTDKGGATYWSWKLQDIGLTAGGWTVQATATLGSQTKSASDAMALEIKE